MDLGVRRRRFALAAAHHVAQRAGRQIRALGHEQDLVRCGQPDPALARPPHAGRGAEQRDLRGVLARDQDARPERDRGVEIGDQHALVARRAQREALEDHAPIRLLDQLDRRRGGRAMHPLREAAQPREHRRVGRDRRELRDDQRERPDQVRERHRRLRDDAELDLTAHEQRAHDQRRDDLDQIVVAGGEEREVAIHRDDPPQRSR